MIKETIFRGGWARFTYRLLKWHIRYLTKRKASPLACGFYITSKCNLRCEFCNIWRIKPGYQTTKEDAKNIIKELGNMGLLYFSFSGGEPLLVPYVFDLLAYAKECGILYTHVVSNGYLMNESRAKELNAANVTEASFSLDGPEEVHDKQRGVKGSFGKVIEAIQNVKTCAPNVKIVLNSILDQAFPENTIFAVNKAKELDVKIKIQPANNHPLFGLDNAANKIRLALSPQEKKKLITTLDLLKNTAHVVNSRAFFENYKAFLFSPEKNVLTNGDCLFGYHHIEVFGNHVFPCLEGLEWKDGVSISGESIKKILTMPAYRLKIEKLRKCINCTRNYYICYYEPRLNFPIWNFLKSRLNLGHN
jgi:MoaA/NifB/PqqE/SkfB family radical SAM enzyme